MVCADCRETFSGGRTCSVCGGELLDVARAEVRREYLEDPELAFSIRFLYQARRGMVLMFLGVMLGLFGGVFSVQQAVVSTSTHGWLWWVAAGALALGGPFLGYVLGTKVVNSTRTAA